MTLHSVPDHGAALSLRKAALIGALVFAVACLLFWATAAARVLPAYSPGFVRSFTPATGVGQLVSGMFWTALFGAVIALLGAGGWNALHRRRGS